MVPDLVFLGNTARATFLNLDPEPFEILKYRIPEYTVYKDGKPFLYNQAEEYLSGNYSRDKYANHYGDCFGYDFDFLDFSSENDTERNLLVIGDSFDNPLLPMLTAHYKHLYNVDLRHNNDFNLINFFETYKVDDVLVIGDYDAVFGSLDWSIPLD